jgi:type IV secretory pathway protease TraF
LVSPIATHDHLGRPLRPYLFCGLVPDGSVFVAAHGDSSLDSRYFGPIPISDLLPAVPLWTFSSP